MDVVPCTTTMITMINGSIVIVYIVVAVGLVLVGLVIVVILVVVLVVATMDGFRCLL